MFRKWPVSGSRGPLHPFTLFRGLLMVISTKKGKKGKKPHIFFLGVPFLFVFFFFMVYYGISGPRSALETFRQ